METFAEKPVIVAGAGRSGLLAARLLAGEGARVTLRDDRPRADVEASLREPIPAGIAFLRGMPGEGEVRGSALLVVSPGVPRERLPLSALAAAGIDGNRRPQTLSVDEWLALRISLGPLPGEAVR